MGVNRKRDDGDTMEPDFGGRIKNALDKSLSEEVPAVSEELIRITREAAGKDEAAGGGNQKAALRHTLRRVSLTAAAAAVLICAVWYMRFSGGGKNGSPMEGQENIQYSMDESENGTGGEGMLSSGASGDMGTEEEEYIIVRKNGIEGEVLVTEPEAIESLRDITDDTGKESKPLQNREKREESGTDACVTEKKDGKWAYCLVIQTGKERKEVKIMAGDAAVPALDEFFNERLEN